MLPLATSIPSRTESAPLSRDRSPAHGLVRAAASGRLPHWADAGPGRRAHMARVAELLDRWAEAAGLDDGERERWRAAGHLHDALRDAAAGELRDSLSGYADVPDALLHGPAAAERLRGVGVDDDELLTAIAFHTLGHEGFGTLGRSLYAADFLEPGRRFLEEERAALRERAADQLDEVVLEVARHRIDDLLRRGMPLHPRTVGFWNALVRETHG